MHFVNFLHCLSSCRRLYSLNHLLLSLNAPEWIWKGKYSTLIYVYSAAQKVNETPIHVQFIWWNSKIKWKNSNEFYIQLYFTVVFCVFSSFFTARGISPQMSQFQFKWILFHMLINQSSITSPLRFHRLFENKEQYAWYSVEKWQSRHSKTIWLLLINVSQKHSFCQTLYDSLIFAFRFVVQHTTLIPAPNKTIYYREHCSRISAPNIALVFLTSPHSC